jgi:hypothetical protein
MGLDKVTCQKREDYGGRCVYVDSGDVCYNVACVNFGAVCPGPEVKAIEGQPLPPPPC